MSIRIVIAGLVGAAIIVGGVLLFESDGTPIPREETASDRILPTTERSSPESAAPRPVRAGWQQYEHESLQFTVDYPTTWIYRTEESGEIAFIPPSPAPQEAEPNPRIILKLVPLVNILGQHASADAWFDTEVLKNPERFDERTDTQDGNPRYSFTEGAGEYPHENIITLHGATAYWFTIETSDPAIHELLPQIANSLQFGQ